jgi:hypothetical protein
VLPSSSGLDAAGVGINPNYVESSSPAWTEETDANSLNTSHHLAPQGAAGTAAWTFTVAAEGWYQVQATGLVTGTPPAGCSYTLIYGTNSVSIALPPTLQFGASHDWSVLATQYLPAGAVTIRLNADATHVAIADGMRMVRCSLQISSLVSDASGHPTATVEIKPAIQPP